MSALPQWLTFAIIRSAYRCGKWNGEPKRFCDLQIDRKFILGRRLHRHVSRIRSTVCGWRRADLRPDYSLQQVVSPGGGGGRGGGEGKTPRRKGPAPLRLGGRGNKTPNFGEKKKKKSRPSFL